MTTTESRQHLIDAHDLVKRYGDVLALDAVGFRLVRGDVAALIGSNGAGKSTLFDILAGLRRPTSGRVTVLGHDPIALPESVKSRLVFVPQEGALPPWASAADLVPLYRSLYPGFDPAALETMLDTWDLPLRSRAMDLSRGERRLVELAVAVSTRPELLFLDEPFRDLDPVMRFSVTDELRGLHASGTTILYSTHILSEVAALATRLLVLRGGSIALERPLGTGDGDLVERLFRKHYGLGDAHGG